MTMIRTLFAAGILLILSLCGAQARPRDDVMTQLFHCNGIENDRQWLDCYYGAAQPARASLGLAPALPAQVQLAKSVPAVAAPVQPSMVRNRVVAAAGGCYDQDNDRVWLDCYYQAALPLREQLGLAVPLSQRGMQSSSSDNRQGVQQVAIAPGAGNVTSRMASYSFDTQRIFTVSLENWQVWQQIDGDSRAAFWTKPPRAYLVTIRAGMSGSFILTVRNEDRVYRVRRIS
jgi:hypothetical protein